MILKKSVPTDGTEEAQHAAALVNEFIDKTHKLWENHEVNRKRAAAGKLKANLVLTRDAGHLLPRFFNINKKYSVKFAALADMVAEKGIAELAGMYASLLPPPSNNLKADCELRVRRLMDELPRFDCFYIHIKGPDEPGHDGNWRRKTDVIAAIDKYFFGVLLREIALKDCVICITADHATPCNLKMHSDTPVPILVSGGKIKGGELTVFSELACARGSLGLLDHGYELMPKLMALLKE